MPFTMSPFLMGILLYYCPLILACIVCLILYFFLVVLGEVTMTMAVFAFERELLVIQFLDVSPPSNSDLDCFRQTLF